MPSGSESKPQRERIDKLLVDRGIADSRTKAQALVLAGIVLADEKRIDKPSELVPFTAALRLKGENREGRYAGRGGLKLEHALKAFRVDPTGWTCLDVGSSTGGFTDCLLKHGAAKIVAVDSGTNQMVWQLRNDPRVELREKTNARNLTRDDFHTEFDLAVIDVSFISLTKIFPAVVPLLKDRGRVIALIKPQFEVGRREVGKGGIVKDAAKHSRVVEEINRFAETMELNCVGVIESPILGSEGNKEFLGLYARNDVGIAVQDHIEFRENVDFYFENGLMVLTEKYLRERGFCCGNKCRHCPYG